MMCTIYQAFDDNGVESFDIKMQSSNANEWHMLDKIIAHQAELFPDDNLSLFFKQPHLTIMKCLFSKKYTHVAYITAYTYYDLVEQLWIYCICTINPITIEKDDK